MRFIKRAAVLVAAGTFALTGCGSDGDGGNEAEPGFTDKSAEEIKDAALEAMGDLDSVALKGSITSDGEEIAMDLKVSGEDCEGSLTIAGGTAQVVSVDGQGFLKGDEKFWVSSTGDEQQGATMAQLIGDRWASVGGSAGFTDELCDLKSLLEDEEEETFAKGDVKEIDGVEVIGIVSTDEEGQETTGWITTSSDHYIVRMDATEGDVGRIDFSDFNEDFEIEAPSGDDVVDLNSLMGG